MKCGLIGEKLGHSFSKEIHQKLGDYEYDLIELAPDELEGFILSGDFDGLNVTIPYKQAVMGYLDEISDLAREAGAVNTVVNKDGKLAGYNTDCGGMKMLIERMGIDLKGKKAFIAGSGGTSRTAAAVCKSLGASEVVRASRSGRNGAVTYEEAYRVCGDAALLINTTPAGMYPDTDSMPFDISRFDRPEGVLDVVYNPLNTRLIQDARSKGIRAENGLYMLVGQAVLASSLFIGSEANESQDITERIYADLLKEKRNIVLTGMPGSGKSTLGKMLAEKLGREMVETDEIISKEAGTSIKEIFANHGEQHFRDLESEVIKRFSVKSGLVISTGGGAILREENISALRLNGVIVFIDRPLDQLKATDSRPLSDDREKLERLYEERYEIYKNTADIVVKTGGAKKDSAKKLWEALK
jgi:shikimate dehydrogenase